MAIDQPETTEAVVDDAGKVRCSCGRVIGEIRGDAFEHTCQRCHRMVRVDADFLRLNIARELARSAQAVLDTHARTLEIIAKLT